jgi:hypothetical protein
MHRAIGNEVLAVETQELTVVRPPASRKAMLAAHTCPAVLHLA